MVKESLIKPSPAVPYPLPGVTTTFTSSSNFSVNDAEVYPSGTLVQIYNVASGKSYKYVNLKKYFRKKGKKLIFSNNLKFTPPRPTVRVDIKKVQTKFNWLPKKKLFEYFEN